MADYSSTETIQCCKCGRVASREGRVKHHPKGLQVISAQCPYCGAETKLPEPIILEIPKVKRK